MEKPKILICDDEEGVRESLKLILEKDYELILSNNGDEALSALNAKICEHIGRDARNLQIGHSYLLDAGKPISSFSKLLKVLQDDILPLIEEYCYEDYATITKILGKSLVDEKNQRIHSELFELPMKDDLIQALKSIDPNLDSSAPALLSESESPVEDEDSSNGESNSG